MESSLSAALVQLSSIYSVGISSSWEQVQCFALQARKIRISGDPSVARNLCQVPRLESLRVSSLSQI